MGVWDNGTMVIWDSGGGASIGSGRSRLWVPSGGITMSE